MRLPDNLLNEKNNPSLKLCSALVATFYVNESGSAISWNKVPSARGM